MKEPASRSYAPLGARVRSGLALELSEEAPESGSGVRLNRSPAPGDTPMPLTSFQLGVRPASARSLWNCRLICRNCRRLGVV